MSKKLVYSALFLISCNTYAMQVNLGRAAAATALGAVPVIGAGAYYSNNFKPYTYFTQFGPCNVDTKDKFRSQYAKGMALGVVPGVNVMVGGFRAADVLIEEEKLDLNNAKTKGFFGGLSLYATAPLAYMLLKSMRYVR